MSLAAAIDRPYDRLASLPRELWLPGLTGAFGDTAARLAHAERWLAALERGELPTVDLDFGDPQAVGPLRRAIGELELPAVASGVPAAAQQVLRTAFWHLDGLIDRPAWQSREAAVAAMVEAFRAEWEIQRSDWENVRGLLQDLGDLANLKWDALRGRLARREWRDAQQLSQLMARLPALAALIASLGRGLPRPQAPRPAPAAPGRTRRLGHVVETRLPDAPGEMRGVRPGRNLARMLPSEAAQLRHPLLHKLWRARLAESRLMVWDEQAVLLDVRPGGPVVVDTAALPEAPPVERGPMLLCIDTSGSMRGAPEPIAKAVVLEAARTAHREKRACRLIAFGGPDELIEHELAFTPAGLDALLDFVGQAFDGGTDLAAPVARAVDLVEQARWRQADLLLVSDGEFGCTPASLARLDAARESLGLRVQGVLVGDRETMGLLEVCDAIHWVRDWRRYAADPEQAHRDGHSPVHSKSLTALYFPNALSERARRSLRDPGT
ncbi:VWA domain-containing protein [uncultured Methylibium sp.]|uniref:VWA domain-containing protein n=1 Tax=uncultured Methylibium sp. TaxID=381093 RepID=UPI0025DE13C3|nr:VWA domain-containing protein [uncultured Methylibium sp.]